MEIVQVDCNKAGICQFAAFCTRFSINSQVYTPDDAAISLAMHRENRESLREPTLSAPILKDSIVLCKN